MSVTGPAIACIGGIVLDRKARVIEKLHPGSSNPVTVTTSPGGVVSNVARSLARLGCRVSLFSIVGDDPLGVSLLRELESAGIDVSNVCHPTKSPTANYTAVLEPNGELFIGLADMAIFDELGARWADGIAPLLAQHQVWILDTNLPAPTLERLLKTHKGSATVLVDPVSVAKSARLRGALDAVDVLFPDRKEAAELSGRPIETRDDVGKAASEIRRLGVGTVVVTLGADGLYIDDGKSGRFLPAMSTEKVRDVTGAGDALVAGFAYGLLAGGDFEPVLYGLAAASLTIETDNSIAEDLNPARLRKKIESSLHARRA